MARIRYIKPGFFENAEVSELPPLARLFWIGLWCWADREGRLLDKPMVLKEAILEHDRCNADRLLAHLAARGFIVRYEADGRRLIQIVNFRLHQNPHINEPASRYPAPPGYEAEQPLKNGAKHHTKHQSENHTGSRAGTRNPELGTRNPELENPESGAGAGGSPDDFTRCVRAFDDMMGRLATTPTIVREIQRWLEDGLAGGDDTEPLATQYRGEAAQWFADACVEAARYDGRSMGYVQKILMRWKREGRGAKRRTGGNESEADAVAEAIRASKAETAERRRGA